ncbi:hypothetical protein, partial [uncultured Desulfovibrio sp.]|uniref:hypothetical protein n=1 Tax=uncultured Desulfovibrio sp. TaxID=167968 RepID=UPI00263B0319
MLAYFHLPQADKLAHVRSFVARRFGKDPGRVKGLPQSGTGVKKKENHFHLVQIFPNADVADGEKQEESGVDPFSTEPLWPRAGGDPAAEAGRPAAPGA